MASTKSATTTRRSSSGKRGKKKDESEVSPARWAGVAFVITAIIAAMALAMISDSDSGSEPASPASADLVEPSPVASASPLDDRVPTAQPRITNPDEGETSELIVPVTVDVPSDELGKKVLDLLVLRGEEVLKEFEEPKPGEKVTVQGVELALGPNELTAVLKGPGGWGPRSEPVVVTVNRDLKQLTIVAPEDGYETYDDTVVLEIDGEPGSRVLVKNQTNTFEQPVTLGPNGQGDVTVTLKKGVANRVQASHRDGARVLKTEKLRVKRLDPRPRVKIKDIAPIDASGLPAKVKVQVTVTDADGNPMPGAKIDYELGGPGRIAMDDVGFTNDKGRATWNPTVADSSSDTEEIQLTVTVQSALSDDVKPVVKTKSIAIE